MHPYTSRENFVTVVGRKPSGATKVTGPGSAYETVRLLHGLAPAKSVTGDIGFFDFRLEPKGARTIGLHFTPDPKMQTRGDITVGKSLPLPARQTQKEAKARKKMPRIKQ